jgi:hypothetical protein
MPKGRPPKKKRNISGLKNQPAPSAIPLPPIVESSGENNGYHNQPDEEPDGGDCILYPLYYYLTYLQYWGWCKYRYREVDKKTFQDAKDTAKQYLEACPTEVIRRFINRSWRFMSAYRLGLTGHAAAWAVKKQKQHRQVSQRAMMSIEAVLNTS